MPERTSSSLARAAKRSASATSTDAFASACFAVASSTAARFPADSASSSGTASTASSCPFLTGVPMSTSHFSTKPATFACSGATSAASIWPGCSTVRRTVAQRAGCTTSTRVAAFAPGRPSLAGAGATQPASAEHERGECQASGSARGWRATSSWARRQARHMPTKTWACHPTVEPFLPPRL